MCRLRNIRHEIPRMTRLNDALSSIKEEKHALQYKRVWSTNFGERVLIERWNIYRMVERRI